MIIFDNDEIEITKELIQKNYKDANEKAEKLGFISYLDKEKTSMHCGEKFRYLVFKWNMLGIEWYEANDIKNSKINKSIDDGIKIFL